MIYYETLAENILGFKASDAQLLDVIVSDANLDKSDIAFSVLIGRHERAIRDAIFFAGARTAEDGEEAYGNFAVKIMRELDKNRLASIRDRENPVKWLRQVARNAAIDYLRTKGREPLDYSGYPGSPDFPDLVDPDAPEPGSSTILDELIADMRRNIQLLGDIYVEVFDLMIRGYTRGEIAEELDIPVGTVDSRRGKIRKILRDHKLIEDDDDGS